VEEGGAGGGGWGSGEGGGRAVGRGREAGAPQEGDHETGSRDNHQRAETL